MVKTEEARSETQYTTPEQYTPKQPKITGDKLNNVLASRTLRDITYKLDPYKHNPDGSSTHHTYTQSRMLRSHSQYFTVFEY